MGDPDGYRNSRKLIGSEGVELEYKYKSSKGFFNVAYSFYTIQNKDVDRANAVETNSAMTLGIAQNKFSLVGSINLGKHVYVSPSVYFLDRRYGYSAVDSNENGMLTEYKPQAMCNVFIGADDLVKNLSFGAGVYNITDEKILYIQAYKSMHAPLPGLGREFYVKLNYNFSFKRQQR